MIDSFSITTRLHALGSSIPVGGLDLRPHISAVGRSPVNSVSVDKGSDNTTSSKISVNPPFRSLLFGGGGNASKQGVALGDVVLMEREEGSVGNDDEFEGQNGNWVSKILHVRSLWSSDQKQGNSENFTVSSSPSCCDDHESCSVYCDHDDDDDEKEEIRFDRDSFSKLLKKVHINEAKLYSQMSYLGNLAYSIPSIEPGNRLKRHSLRFVTSSIEKREQLALAEKNEQQSIENETEDNESEVEELNYDEQKETEKSRVTTSVAFRIAASAASYLQSHTTTLLPFRSPKKEGEEGVENVDGSNGKLEFNSEMASLMATTDSVTAVVAAKEEVKQAVADDLSSISSSPCEWYICEDEKSATRFFVIQGSETIASWQANLLFEPVKFEGLDVFVHRGIYEAAKGMYQQMLPEVHAHIKAHGGRAKFRFTGHSLGGSLSLLINLMLLVRGEVPYSSLLPVITFGSPCIMCGGDGLLSKLGLPKSHVQAIVMHRDIVPRAFSCIYPMPATELLKAMNRNFRNHPCLNNQNLLYAPMGETLILQPDDKYSPHHDLLPSGSGLYLLTSNAKESEQQLRAAMNAFLNNPHPLETLSDRSAYGHGGSIQRDHDMNSYLKCLRAVIRQELSRMRKAERDRRRKVWWAPLVEARVILGPSNVGRSQFNFSGIVRSGRESVKRFSRFIASQRMHLLVLVLFPARLLLIGTFTA